MPGASVRSRPDEAIRRPTRTSTRRQPEFKPNKAVFLISPRSGIFETRRQANGGLSQQRTKGKYERMSDAVLIALIAGTPGVVSTVFGFLNQIMIRRAVPLAEKAADIGEKAATLGARAAELGEKNEKHLSETKMAMVTLEKNTNSIKDALVETTAIANRAIGNREGRAELQAEHDGGEENSG